MSGDGSRDTPSTVVGAIAAGVAPAPFLVTYSVLFILHGTVFPVDPPDITGSKNGEALAGVLALAFLAVIVVGLGLFLSQRTRWLFLVGQLATLGVSVDFLLDSTSGRPAVPFVLAITSTAAVVLGCVPASWSWTSADDDSAPPGGRRSQGDQVDEWGMPTHWDSGDQPGGWAAAEPDGGPIDPNPGAGHSASAPKSA
jgi:hypothetical protein